MSTVLKPQKSKSEKMNSSLASVSAWVVLTCALLMTLWTWNSFRIAFEQESERTFDLKSKSVHINIMDRLLVFEQVLNGVRGLLYAATPKEVTRNEWHIYASNLDLEETYPALQALGYSQYITAASVQNHIQSIRNQGLSDYTVHPSGKRDEYTAVTQLEPNNERNARELGFDMFSESTRRTAMLRARDTGQASITTMITLLGGESSSGFIMFLPVYEKDRPVNTQEERRAAITGYVFGVFHMDTLINRVLRKQEASATLHIYDGPVIEPSKLIYSSNQVNADIAQIWPSHTSQLNLNAGGSQWTLLLNSTPEFERTIGRFAPWLVLVTGLALSFLLFLVMWQITRTRSEALGQLKGFKRKYELLLNSAGEGIFGLDLEGNCTFANPMAAKLLGWTNRELISTLNHQLIHHTRSSGERYLQEECQIYASIKDGEIRYVDDEVFWCKDGSSMQVAYTSTPILDDEHTIQGAVVTFQDITERKRAEHALQASEERNRRIVDTAHDAFIAMDEEGMIMQWNAQAEQMFGWKHQDALGCRLSDMLIPNRFKQAHIHGLKHFNETGEGPVFGQLLELTALHADGHELPIELTISPMRLNEGYIFGAFLRDITERKQAEKNLAEKTDELTRSNQELQQFATVASHDLQEPLRKIQTFAERLRKEEGVNVTENGIANLSRMLDAATRMRSLINDLLSYSRVGTNTEPYANVNLNILANEVISDLEVSIEASGAKIEISPLPNIHADPMQMRQLFQNLIGNAIKFSKKEAAPVIKVHAEWSDNKVATSAENLYHLYFQDNGIGFEEQYAERIFAPFERLHGREDYKGTGIGLAICQKIANRHKGHIKAIGNPGNGATFIVSLPANQLNLEHINE